MNLTAKSNTLPPRKTVPSMSKTKSFFVFRARFNAVVMSGTPFGFPLMAAKQGRGNESVSGGDREPRLTEPQRDSCQRQLTDEV